ncbi:MAG: sulfotransferase [Rhodospirillales bacterium]|nr:MAG: sulfotransferase [Rhodospirillales bacterium]
MKHRKSFLEAQKLHREGRISEAERRYRKLIRKSPGSPEISFYLGLALLQSGRGDEAVGYFETVVRVAPNDPVAQDHFGQALLAAGEHEQAIAHHMRARDLAPGKPENFINLGVALERADLLPKAEEQYRKAISLAPNFFPALANLGAVLYKLGRYTAAIPVLRRAHQLNPAAPEPLATLAFALEHTHQMEEADRLTEKFVAIAPGHPAGLLLEGQKQARSGNTRSASELLRRATAAPLEDNRRAHAWFELGKLQDKQGDYADAFQSYLRSNELMALASQATGVDRDEMFRTIRAYMQSSTATWVTEKTAQLTGDLRPLFFFVGFPRSGTTLMEQILGAHPNVETTNELSPFAATLRDAANWTKLPIPKALGQLTADQLNRLRANFLQDARKITGSDLTDRCLVDKQPLNIVELGPIQFVLPEAAAIIALRDPRDVCLSCFFQQFSLNQGMVHFLSLETTARFYAAVMELWNHYRKILPIRWIEYRYEDLVADFEGTVSGVLDFMDLPWNDSVNRYAERARSRDIHTPSRTAVTQAINDRAVSRWRNYAEQMTPILPILEPFVREFGYEPS